MSSLINKAKETIQNTLDKNKSSNQTDNPSSGNYGPHGTSTGNRLDPKVDSDLDHRNDPTSRVGGYGNTQATDQYGMNQGAGNTQTTDRYGMNQGAGNAQTTDQYGMNQGAGNMRPFDGSAPQTNDPAYDNVQSGNTGPHSSNLLNKVDPRVDSNQGRPNDPMTHAGGVGNTQTYGDNYGQGGGAPGFGTSDAGYDRSGATGVSGTHGNAPTHHSTTHAGHHSHGHHAGHTGGLAAATTTGTGGMGGGMGGGNTYDNPRSTNEGPHGSNLMNKLDPRTDSDRDHRNDPTSRVGGYGGQGDNYGQNTNTLGDPTMTGGTGAYGAGAAQEGYAGADRTGAMGGYDDSSRLPGSGNASNTAGPHNSNIVNKLDPRVDSDLDGSKTYGGNQTHR